MIEWWIKCFCVHYKSIQFRCWEKLSIFILGTVKSMEKYSPLPLLSLRTICTAKLHPPKTYCRINFISITVASWFQEATLCYLWKRKQLFIWWLLRRPAKIKFKSMLECSKDERIQLSSKSAVPPQSDSSLIKNCSKSMDKNQISWFWFTLAASSTLTKPFRKKK